MIDWEVKIYSSRKWTLQKHMQQRNKSNIGFFDKNSATKEHEVILTSDQSHINHTKIMQSEHQTQSPHKHVPSTATDFKIIFKSKYSFS